MFHKILVKLKMFKVFVAGCTIVPWRRWGV